MINRLGYSSSDNVGASGLGAGGATYKAPTGVAEEQELKFAAFAAAFMMSPRSKTHQAIDERDALKSVSARERFRADQPDSLKLVGPA